MLHRPYGPRGAESEDPEFWTDLTRNSDFLPEPGIVNPVLRSAQEPYTPADAHQDRQTIDDENLASHNDPLGSCNLVRRTEKGRLRRRGWGLRWEKAQKGGKGTNLRGFFED